MSRTLSEMSELRGRTKAAKPADLQLTVERCSPSPRCTASRTEKEGELPRLGFIGIRSPEASSSLGGEYDAAQLPYVSLKRGITYLDPKEVTAT